MKINFSKIDIKKNIIVYTILLFYMLYCFNESFINYNFFFSLTNFVIATISIFTIFKLDDRPFSLHKMFFLFMFFFYAIAPLIQYSNNVKLWGDDIILDNDYIFTNIVIIFIIVIYSFIYNKILIANKRKFIRIRFKSLIKFDSLDSVKKPQRLIFISIISTIGVLLFYRFQLLPLFIRNADLYQHNLMNILLVSFVLRPIPVVGLLIFKLSKYKGLYFELILWSLVLLIDFPTGLPRLQTAALYIPIMFAYFPTLRKNFVFSLFIIGGLLFAFPFLNLFRMDYISQLTSLELTFIDLDMFMKGHFDNYINFVRILKHEIITDGEQLLGVLLFFIPRAIWPNKPENSGLLIYEKLDLYFDNISVNYFAEGYLNFGYLGIIIFIVLFAFLNAKMDKHFWIVNKGSLSREVRFTSLYLSLFGMMFFILRGALLSAFPLTLGLLLAVYIVFFILNVKISKQK